MNSLNKKIKSKRGEITLAHTLGIAMIIVGLIATFAMFSGLFGDVIDGPWSPAEKTANDAYCKTQGSDGWAGGYANSLPVCK